MARETNKLKHRIIPILVFTLPALMSCRKSETVWSGVHNFHGNRWIARETVEFRPDSGYFSDVSSPKGILSVRYGRDCQPLDLPIAIEMESPVTGFLTTDTVKIHFLPGELRSGDRSRLGVFESVDTVSLSPTPSDGWLMTVRQLSDTTISDIYSLTLEILK